MTTRISRDERVFYLEKLRAKAKAGDVAAMGEIVRCEQMRELKRQLMIDGLCFDDIRAELVAPCDDGLSETEKAQWIEETE